MLKNFIYLNEQALDSYLGGLEDGLRSSVAEKSATAGSMSGGGDAKLVRLEGEKSHAEEATTSRTDTPSARFERLQRLALADVEASGWVQVVNPQDDLVNIGIGALVDIECEIYEPEMMKALSKKGGIAEVIDQMQALAPLASMMGKDMAGLPPSNQLDAIKGFANALGGDAFMIGEPNEGEWRVAGKLVDSYLHGEIEGYARVVGKVSTVIPTGSQKPLLALPGMNLMSREKRREMERQGPSEGQEGNWLAGPALMLEVLAIYR